MFTSTAEAWENKALMKKLKTQIKNPRHEVMFDYGVKLTSRVAQEALSHTLASTISSYHDYIFSTKKRYLFPRTFFG